MSITKATTALHVWASNKKELGTRHGGLPAPGSWFDRACRKHGIRPGAAPILARGNRQFEATLLERIDLEDVSVFADVTGASPMLGLFAHERWGCDVLLVDLDKRGGFAKSPSRWLRKYREYLLDQGVAPEKIREARSVADLEGCEVIANLSGFGDTLKIAHLEPVLDNCLTASTILLADVRKGSGAFPFLNRYGECEILSNRRLDDQSVHRVMFRATRVTAREKGAGNAADWAGIAAGLAGEEGWYRANSDHSFLFVPRDADTLVVTFDNLDIAMEKREDRRPWGFSFIEKQGWSMLGVMANGWTWYRDPGFGISSTIWRKAASSRASAAWSFMAPPWVAMPPAPSARPIRAARCWPSARNPRSTRRSSPGRRAMSSPGARFSGRYGDAALVSAAAAKVTLLYDPYEALDSAHVARFENPNVLKLRAPLLGHRLGSSLQQMGVLSPITLGALNGTLTEVDFYRTLRARKSFGRYQKELFKKAMARGRPDLARRVGRFVLTRGANRYIRKEMATLA
ncbi:hypothetical protein ACFSHQ_12920 [Gemmobacter lanyuensis]